MQSTKDKGPQSAGDYGCTTGCLTVLLALGLWLVFWAWRADRQTDATLFGAGCGIVLILVVALMLFDLFRRYFSRRTLSSVEVRTDTEKGDQGTQLRITVRAKPQRDAKVRSATLRLVAREHGSTRSLVDRDHVPTIAVRFEHQRTVEIDQTWRAGVHSGFSVTFDLPKEIPTATNPQAHIEWQLELTIHLAGRPDYLDDRKIPAPV